MGDVMKDQRRRTLTLKATVVGTDVRPSTSVQDERAEELGGIFGGTNILEPSYDPSTLIRWTENSSALLPNIAAYVTNIDGLGYRFAPRIDLDSDDAFEKVRDALWMERVAEAELQATPIGTGTPNDPIQLRPSDEEVTTAISSLKVRSRLEYGKVVAFFEHVYPDGSFVTLRRNTRFDLEVTGNAYWEILRDRQGRIARFVHVPPAYVRCTPQDDDAVIVTERVRVGLGWDVVRQPRFFRRYVQAIGSKKVWFKQFGDPRIVSRETGQVYEDIVDFTKQARKNDQPATEIVHFKIYSPGEPYGVPRWIGNLLSVLGSRAADEVNFNYFDNKSVPPMALLVSGGRLAAESVDKIETYIRDNLRGRENFHKILVIEAEAEADPLTARENPVIKMERLTDAQQGDALFQKYDERNIDKVGSMFRMPRLLRGDVRDFNKSTAESSLRFSDEQVFGPERGEFDSWVNRTILPELNIALWVFRTNGPQSHDQSLMNEVIMGLSKVGTIVPNEARELASDMLGRDLSPIDEDWAKQPLQLTVVETTMGAMRPGRPPNEQSTGTTEEAGVPTVDVQQRLDQITQHIEEVADNVLRQRRANEED